MYVGLLLFFFLFLFCVVYYHIKMLEKQKVYIEIKQQNLDFN